MPSIVWKGHLTFGLVSIPVKLFRAARRARSPALRPPTRTRGDVADRAHQHARPRTEQALQTSHVSTLLTRVGSDVIMYIQGLYKGEGHESDGKEVGQQRGREDSGLRHAGHGP